jgi:hypothetical protein
MNGKESLFKCTLTFVVSVHRRWDSDVQRKIAAECEAALIEQYYSTGTPSNPRGPAVRKSSAKAGFTLSEKLAQSVGNYWSRAT